MFSVVRSHLAYEGGRESTGIPRSINRICEKSLMYASQQNKRLIDEHLVHYIIEHVMNGNYICLWNPVLVSPEYL